MHQQVRARLSERLRERGIDAYLAYTCPNIYYTTGYLSEFLDISWQMMGTDMAVIPSSPHQTPAILVSNFSEAYARSVSDVEDIQTYTLWTECRDLEVVMGRANDFTGEARPAMPEQFRYAEIHETLARMLGSRGLTEAVIGTDLKYMSKETIDWLRKTNPRCEFVDVSDIMYELRKIKYPNEVQILRNAAFLYEAGIARLLSGIQDNRSLAEIRCDFDRGVLDALEARPSLGDFQGTWAFISVGALGNTRVKRGDIIKPDCGVKIDGYFSDCSRVFCFGPPQDIHLQIHDALLAGFIKAESLLRPGVTMREVFEAAQTEIRTRGFPNYTRGHFGHSIGMDPHVEEPPFIGPNDTVLEPGMVLCLETPYYDKSLGGFNIEDMVLITENGHENFNTLRHDLVEI